jgi:hypothetical protein
VYGIPHQGRFAFRNREFAHREQVDKLFLFNGTLAENVEGTDGFHLVAKELDTDRMRIQKTVHIHNATANGELAHTAHHGLFDRTHDPGTKA